MRVLRVDNYAEELIGLVVLVEDVGFGRCPSLHSHCHIAFLLVLEQHKILRSERHIVLHFVVLAVVVDIGLVCLFGSHLTALVESEGGEDNWFVPSFFVSHVNLHQE